MRASLCGECRHVKKIETARGSIFYLCRISEVDEQLTKYPPQPVISCSSYQPQTHDSPARTSK